MNMNKNMNMNILHEEGNKPVLLQLQATLTAPQVEVCICLWPHKKTFLRFCNSRQSDPADEDSNDNNPSNRLHHLPLFEPKWTSW